MTWSIYAAYMLHVFVASFFQSLVLDEASPPTLKFFLVPLITVPTSFLLASLIRRPLHL
jgi:peptidoglycan/LPS O-acetylase OafA/YrhL